MVIMSNDWTPINEAEFLALFAQQYAELDESEKKQFDRYKVQPWQAVIRRSDETGDELVFVIAQNEEGVLYFDDVEYGFNVSSIDGCLRIVSPGGSQNTLRDAVIEWFPT